MNKKQILITAGIAMGVLILIIGIVGLFTKKTVSPVMMVVIHRRCDFVTIRNETLTVCEDGSQWEVDQIPENPAPTPESRVIPAAEPAGDIRVIDEQAWPNVVASEPVVFVEPTEEVVRGDEVPAMAMLVRYSHYWPALGGVNCFSFVDGQCVSRMASGYRWQDYINKAVACPPEWEFGTEVEFEGKVWTCLDRGGKIKYVEGIPWVDFLEEKGVHAHGSIITVRVTRQ